MTPFAPHHSELDKLKALRRKSGLYSALCDLAKARDERNEALAEEESSKCRECDGQGSYTKYETRDYGRDVGSEYGLFKRECEACEGTGRAQ